MTQQRGEPRLRPRLEKFTGDTILFIFVILGIIAGTLLNFNVILKSTTIRKNTVRYKGTTSSEIIFGSMVENCFKSHSLKVKNNLTFFHKSFIIADIYQNCNKVETNFTKDNMRNVFSRRISVLVRPFLITIFTIFMIDVFLLGLMRTSC